MIVLILHSNQQFRPLFLFKANTCFAKHDSPSSSSLSPSHLCPTNLWQKGNLHCLQNTLDVASHPSMQHGLAGVYCRLFVDCHLQGYFFTSCKLPILSLNDTSTTSVILFPSSISFPLSCSTSSHCQCV